MQELSKGVRSLVDWAIRLEGEGKTKDYDLFETVRCLNC